MRFIDHDVCHSSPMITTLWPDSTAGPAVDVRTLEAEDHEHGALGLDDHGPEERASRAAAWSSGLGAQTSEVRVSRVQGSEPSALPLMSVATPPLSATMSRLAAMSNTRTRTGAQKASKLPAAVCAIASAIEPRMRILVDRWMRPRAPTSAPGRLIQRSTKIRILGSMALAI